MRKHIFEHFESNIIKFEGNISVIKKIQQIYQFKNPGIIPTTHKIVTPIINKSSLI